MATINITGENLLTEFQAGISIKEQIEHSYIVSKNKRIDFNKYLLDLKTVLVEAKPASISSINFISLKDTTKLNPKRKEQICKLGLRILLKQDLDDANNKVCTIIENLTDVDPDFAQQISDLTCLEKKALIILFTKYRHVSKNDVQNFIVLCKGIQNETEIELIKTLLDPIQVLITLGTYIDVLQRLQSFKSKFCFVHRWSDNLRSLLFKMDSPQSKENLINFLSSDKVEGLEIAFLKVIHRLRVKEKSQFLDVLFADDTITKIDEACLIYLLNCHGLNLENLKSSLKFLEDLNISKNIKDSNLYYYLIARSLSLSEDIQNVIVEKVNNYEFNNDDDKVLASLLLTLFSDLTIDLLLNDFKLNTSNCYYLFLFKLRDNLVPYHDIRQRCQRFSEIDPKCFEENTTQVLHEEYWTIENLNTLSKLSYHFDLEDLRDLICSKNSEKRYIKLLNLLLTVIERLPETNKDINFQNTLNFFIDCNHFLDFTKKVLSFIEMLDMIDVNKKELYIEYVFDMIRTSKKMSLLEFKKINTFFYAEFLVSIKNPKSDHYARLFAIYNIISDPLVKYLSLIPLSTLNEKELYLENILFVQSFITNEAYYNFTFYNVNTDFIDFCKLMHKITERLPVLTTPSRIPNCLYITLKNIPSKLRSDIFEKYLPLIVDETNNLEKRAALFSFFEHATTVDDLKLFDQLIKIYQSLGKSKLEYMTLVNLAVGDDTKRKIAKLTELAELFSNENAISEKLSKVINTFPDENRTFNLIKEYHFLIKENSSNIILAKAPPSHQIAILDAIRNMAWGEPRKKFIEYTLEIMPSEIRLGIIKDVLKFSSEVEDDPVVTKMILLRTFARIPHKDRTYELYTSLKQYTINHLHTYFPVPPLRLINYFLEVPEEKRAKAFITALPVLSNCWPTMCYPLIIHTASVIEDSTSLEHLKQIIEGSTTEDVIVQVLFSLIPEDHRSQPMHQKLKDLVKECTVQAFFEILSYIPQNIVTPYFVNTIYRTLALGGPKSINETVSFFIAIPPQYYKEFASNPYTYATHLTNYEHVKEVFDFLFNQIPEEIKDRHIIKTLTTVTEASIVHSLAQTILDHADIFKIDTDINALEFDTAVTARNLTSEDELKKTNNPYRIYEYISRVVPSEPLLDIAMSSQEVGGETVTLNLAKLQREGEWSGYKAQDLPEGIPTTALQDLFNRIEARLDTLSNEDRRKAYEEMHEISEVKIAGIEGIFEFLKNSILKSPYIPPLMIESGSTISKEKFYLFCVLRSIFDESNELKQGEYLTAQERSFLTMASMIQLCDEGQFDGVTRCFKLLDERYKTGAADDLYGNLLHMVQRTVQQTLGSIAEDTHLLKELTGNKRLSQINHTVNYVLARFCRQIGLKHAPRFDFHTHVLDSQLLMLPTDFALDFIFKKVTPKLFVNNLVKLANQNPTGLKDFMPGMEELFRLNGKGLIDEGYIGMDEDMVNFELTEKGATAIFKALGYFTG